MRYSPSYFIHTCTCFILWLVLYPELPALRKVSENPDGRRRFDPMASCQVAFIKWVANFTHAVKKGEAGFASSVPTNRCVPISSHSQALSQLHSQVQPHSLHLSLQSHSYSHLSATPIPQANSNYSSQAIQLNIQGLRYVQFFPCNLHAVGFYFCGRPCSYI